MDRSRQRRRAIEAAKLAVRAYARDPSAAKAAAVELAWQRARQLDSLARWRQPSLSRADYSSSKITQ